jgi:hypothetical protein
MLISKGTAVGEIVSIKLITGDEIIAKLEDESTDYIKISRPLMIVPGPDGLGMIPYVFLAQNELMKIQMDHVIILSPSKKDAADQYIQGTTGIALK